MSSNHIITFLIFLIFQTLGCKSQIETGNENPESVFWFPNQLRYPLMRSDDFGKTWTNAAEDLPVEIQVSFIERKGEEIVMATDNLGLFISQNNRTKWQSIGAKLPGQKINSLHIFENKIYAGVFREGIFFSEDDGLTWTSLNYDLPNLSVQSIWRFENQILAGTDFGIFILPEGEKNWKSTSVKAQTLSIFSREGILAAGTSLGTVVSKDKGKTWAWVRKESAVHYTHNIGKRMIEFVLTGDVFYSEDWGKTWIETKYSPREGSYVYEMAKVGDYQLMSNNYGILRSADDGKNWNLIYPTENSAFFDFLVIGNEIYGGTRTWDEYRKRD